MGKGKVRKDGWRRTKEGGREGEREGNVRAHLRRKLVHLCLHIDEIGETCSER